MVTDKYIPGVRVVARNVLKVVHWVVGVFPFVNDSVYICDWAKLLFAVNAKTIFSNKICKNDLIVITIKFRYVGKIRLKKLIFNTYYDETEGGNYLGKAEMPIVNIFMAIYNKGAQKFVPLYYMFY